MRGWLDALPPRVYEGGAESSAHWWRGGERNRLNVPHSALHFRINNRTHTVEIVVHIQITKPDLGYRLYAANGKIGIWRTGAKRNRFPRGEAVERSETDEEWRYEPISYSVRKKGTA